MGGPGNAELLGRLDAAFKVLTMEHQTKICFRSISLFNCPQPLVDQE